jgi:hypothetical protein
MDMEVLIPFILIAIFLGGSILYSITKKRRLFALLEEAAVKYELTFTKGSLMTYPYVSGRIEKYPVRMEKYSFSFGRSKVDTLKFEIDIGNENLHAFSINAESIVSRMKKIFGKDDILTGDELFDDIALIKGYINFSDIRSFEDIKHNLNSAILLAKNFCRKGNPVDLIKKNYPAETAKKVKKKLLNTLYSMKGFLPPDDPMIKKVLKDKSAEIQFLGARLLGKNGYDLLRKIYEQGDVYIKKRIISHLTNGRESSFLDFFLEHAEKESDITVKQKLAGYFRMTRNNKAEPFLRKELHVQRGNESIHDFVSYKLAIIWALKYCGTYESIEPLYRINQPALKREADEAIAMIQDRIGAGDKGWLSISTETDSEGGLSLADEQDGDD